MARMHSRKKGKAKSKKPSMKIKSIWVNYKNKEIEALVIKLAKTGKPSSQIGLILRDSYGIPDVKSITKKKITKILEENKLKPELPEDLRDLIKKQIMVIKHLEENKKDKTAKRGLQLTEAKIFRLIKYYKKSKKLPQEWKYDLEKAKLIIG